MTEIRAIAPLDMSGDVSKNWSFWIQKFKNYLKATEIDKKTEDIQCAQLLQLIGDEGIRIFNTFKIDEKDKDKIAIFIGEFDNFFSTKNKFSV